VIDSLSALSRLVSPAPSADLLAPVTLSLRAWPWLCDFSGHVNNARYIDLMGLGRAVWLQRAGLFRRAMLGGYAYIVAGTGITYRRSIPSLGSFTLETRVAGFDERWLYFEYVTRIGGGTGVQVASQGFTRGQVQRRGRGMRPLDGLSALSHTKVPEAPVPSAALKAWLSAQESALGHIRGLDA
jgi:acyl-CoA thioesterase FadM